MYKYINENQIEQCPRVIEDKENNICYANPPAEIQKQFGYDRNYEDTPYPVTEEGYYRTFTYSDTNPIQKIWSEPIRYPKIKDQ